MVRASERIKKPLSFTPPCHYHQDILISRSESKRVLSAIEIQKQLQPSLHSSLDVRVLGRGCYFNFPENLLQVRVLMKLLQNNDTPLQYDVIITPGDLFDNRIQQKKSVYCWNFFWSTLVTVTLRYVTLESKRIFSIHCWISLF